MVLANLDDDDNSAKKPPLNDLLVVDFSDPGKS